MHNWQFYQQLLWQLGSSTELGFSKFNLEKVFPLNSLFNFLTMESMIIRTLCIYFVLFSTKYHLCWEISFFRCIHNCHQTYKGLQWTKLLIGSSGTQGNKDPTPFKSSYRYIGIQIIWSDHPHHNHHPDTFSNVCQGQVRPLELFAAAVPQPSLLAC